MFIFTLCRACPIKRGEDLAFRVMRHLGVPASERCSDDDMNALALAIREWRAAHCVDAAIAEPKRARLPQ